MTTADDGVKYDITTEGLGGSFRHGKMTVRRLDEHEASVEISAKFVVGRDASPADALLDEVNALVRRHAI